jgi:hypothetical protein
MIARWLRRPIWEPYERACRVLPLWPFRAVVTEPADGVRYIRIDNAIVRLLSRIAGGSSSNRAPPRWSFPRPNS